MRELATAHVKATLLPRRNLSASAPKQRGRYRARQTRRRVQQTKLEPAHACGMIKDVQEREHDADGEKVQEIKRGHPPEGDGACGLRAHGRARE